MTTATHKHAQQIIENAWLRLGDVTKIKRENPLRRVPKDKEHIGYSLVKTMCNAQYLSFAAKTLLGIRILPEQAVILEEMWNRPFPMYIASRGFGKSFLIALYCMLKLILTPNARGGGAGVKIVIVGAAFRQSKVIYEYMETIWRSSPVFRSACSSDSGPKKDVDRCTVKVNENWAIAIPLGDGSKIRGLRATIIIADEFASIPPDIYETVVQGFAAVSSDPIQNVDEVFRREAKKELGLWSEEQEEAFKEKTGNQIIISGTADYEFKPFATYWKRYHDFITSKGNPEKLKPWFPDGIPESFDYRHYSIIRIPYELIPKGFMDDRVVMRAKATIHSGIYQMEYGACEDANNLITTSSGIKRMFDVEVGDYVLTHKGRFQKVLKKKYREYDGNMYVYKTLGSNQTYRVTADHPFWYGDERFEPLHDNNTCLVNLNELEGNYILSTSLCCTDYLETINQDRYYPRSSQSKITLVEQRDIRSQHKTQKELADKYNLTQSAISYIQTDKRVPKNAIPSDIKLDYDFGLIIGYYAAEGSVGADGRQVSFALDEHKDTEYQKQLLKAIRNVFGFQGKQYYKKKNTVEICVNSRLIAQIVKYICPGLSQDKLIRHDIMFANEECLRGIIEGYWNGDGHIGRTSDAHCSNQHLLNQIRLGLSYFNISSTLNYKSDGTYNLSMSGENHRNFLAEFYNIPNLVDRDTSLIRNMNGMSILPIIEKTTVPYKGLVYNLEVEEDHSYSSLNATTHNCFTSDSNGFFKRSLIEACVASDKNPVMLPSGQIWFDALTRGNPQAKYVYGVDPASEADNFSIVVLQLEQDHARVVYCWTTNREDFKKRIKANLTQEGDFYGFCARKIRELMRTFPCEKIGIDAQGGGIAVMEALHDKDKLREGELPIWPVINPDKPLDTDGNPGLHILELIQFANYEWTSTANHGLRKDLEDRVLLFPRFDPLTLELAVAEDKIRSDNYSSKHPGKTLTIYDSLEDCVMEIEELKNELTTIVISRTGTGVNSRDRWDTPEIKLDNGRKGRLRKDRYSSLVIANMLARQIHRTPARAEYDAIGGFTSSLGYSDSSGNLYNGPSWFTEKVNDSYRGAKRIRH